MKKTTHVALKLSLILMIGIPVLSIAKRLDKASPLLAGQIEKNLRTAFSQQQLNMNPNDVILWSSSDKVTPNTAKSAAWCIPVDLSKEELSGVNDINSALVLLGKNKRALLQKEIQAVEKAFISAGKNLTAHGYDLTTYVYTGPVETQARVGIVSPSSDVGIITAKNSIASALSSRTHKNKRKIKAGLVLLEW